MGSFASIRFNGRPGGLYTGTGATDTLIFSPHPGGSNSINWRTKSGLDVTANAANCYVLYPNGHADPQIASGLSKTWNVGRGKHECCGYARRRRAPDEDYLADMLAYYIKLLNIDPNKVYIATYSNGGMVSYKMIAKYPALVKRMTVMAGTYCGVRKECKPGIVTKVMHIYGTADDVVPPAGGASTQVNPYTSVPYDFPALVDWQAYLTANGITINNIVLPGAAHDEDSINAALGASPFNSRAYDMVKGTGTWAGLT